ncbi:MAG: acetyl-CoA decarbonylase/synthase complex subunit gamma [Deltaproteobacteria bacterium]|nr:acetyl-CoA decarbonylase/synthase complex subunit gamma [Deltaproteobacteria bacterium]
MGLTGIQIFKLLPKTNCGECGVPTCLAFAMNLASGKAELDKCPYVSEEAKAQLSEASAPPIRPLKVGVGETEAKMGGETVMYRHEKTFYSPPGFAAVITDDTDPKEIEAKLARFVSLQFIRVGLNLRPELVACKNVSGDAGKFTALVKTVLDKSDMGLVLMADKVDVMKAALALCADQRPLLYAATAANCEAMGALAKEMNCPLAVKADSVADLIPLTDKLTGMGLKDLVLDPGSRTVKQAFEDEVAIRRAPLMAGNKSLGFPTITFPCEMADNIFTETMVAGMFVSKYGGMMVMSDFVGESIFPLLVQRLNIFTDPQRPMTVVQGIYDINGPDENSPVLITTNFSLTYFIVTGEIEASRVPSWLCVMDTEGLSVMTAWAAGKFVGDAVGAFIKKSGIDSKVKHRTLIIPGYAASISGDLEEELPGWSVQIGPREAAHITKFLKTWKA